MATDQEENASDDKAPARELARREGIPRRGLLATLAAAPMLGVAGATARANEEAVARAQAALKGARGTKLVLLGTGGGPAPGQERRMASHVMLHNGAAYLLDCGLGVTDQYARCGIPFGALRSIFITHHHPDHNIEYGPLLVIGWIQGMPQSVRACGPPPLKQMTEDFHRAYRQTIDFWAEDLNMKPLDVIDVLEISSGGLAMQDDNVKVSATLVKHPPVKPAFAYRFDFADRSIAFSGDTVPLAAVAELAKGADILVHEAMNIPAVEAALRRRIAAGIPGTFDAMMNHMLADHSPTEEVGRIATEAGVKTLVLSHLVPGGTDVTEASWREAAAKHFKGEIIVGHDMMVI